MARVRESRQHARPGLDRDAAGAGGVLPRDRQSTRFTAEDADARAVPRNRSEARDDLQGLVLPAVPDTGRTPSRCHIRKICMMPLAYYGSYVRESLSRRQIVQFSNTGRVKTRGPIQSAVRTSLSKSKHFLIIGG